MRKKSLLETNPYLKNPELRKALLSLLVSSSTAVEGILTKYPKLSNSMKKKLKAVTAAQKSSTSSE
jgi:hypothetical protein